MYVKIGPEVLKMHQAKATLSAIATKLKTTLKNVKEALEFIRTGRRPQWTKEAEAKRAPRLEGPRRQLDGTKSQRYAEFVARLRDEDRMTFPAICEEIRKQFQEDISVDTARRAYDHAHPEEVDRVVEEGGTTRRGAYCFIGEEKFRQIRRLLGEAKLNCEGIAKLVGCGVVTVFREKRRLADQENEEDKQKRRKKEM